MTLRLRPPSLSLRFDEPAGIERLARSLEPDMRDAFLAAVVEFGTQVALTDLVEAVGAGDLAAAISAMDPADLEAALSNGLTPKIAEAVTRGGQLAAADATVDFGVTVDFDAASPTAQEWIDAHAAELVQQVTAETMEAIRTIVRDAFTRGGTPRSTALQIKQRIGLTVRGANAVARLEAALIADGYGPEYVQRRVLEYTNRLLMQRATNIARTETLTASNRGQQALWEQAAEAGYLDRGRAKRVWVIAPSGDRVCPICRGLAGKTAALNEPFPGGYSQPPAHPSCRCSMTIRPNG